MTTLETKLQYKGYERGEFADKRERTLEETIELIQHFPWDAQRGQAIEPTGPSITIKDDFYNYLKIGLYFNGKYCLYYFDTYGDFYERHIASLSEIYPIATDFFNNRLDVSLFEKHIFSIGVKKNFDDKSFIYTINKLSVWVNLVVFLFSFLFILAFISNMPRSGNSFYLIVIVLLVMLALIIIKVYFVLKLYSKIKNMSVQISAGTDDFSVSENGGDWVRYNKNNVTKINMYGRTGRRSSDKFNLTEIIWKDGQKLIIPGAIIESDILIHKFRNIEAANKNSYFPFSKIYWEYVKSKS